MYRGKLLYAGLRNLSNFVMSYIFKIKEVANELAPVTARSLSSPSWRLLAHVDDSRQVSLVYKPAKRPDSPARRTRKVDVVNSQSKPHAAAIWQGFKARGVTTDMFSFCSDRRSTACLKEPEAR